MAHRTRRHTPVSVCRDASCESADQQALLTCRPDVELGHGCRWPGHHALVVGPYRTALHAPSCRPHRFPCAEGRLVILSNVPLINVLNRQSLMQ